MRARLRRDRTAEGASPHVADTGVSSEPRGFGTGAASGVVVSSAIAAASGYLILVIVAHRLTPSQNADFLAYWAALFAVIGILGGIQNETIRAVGSHALGPTDTLPPADQPTPHASTLQNGLVVGVALALLVGLTSLWWGSHIFPRGTVHQVMLLMLAAAAYAGHLAVSGAAAGRGDWRTYSWLMGVEAAWRLAVVALVALLSADIVGIAWACVSSAAVWPLMVLVSRPARRAAHGRADVSQRALLTNTGHALVSAGSTSALVVGFPILLRVTSSETAYAVAAPLLLAVSITRAPIMIPLQAFQGVFITWFLGARQGAVRKLVIATAALVGVGLLAALGAVFVGRYVMALFGSGYEVSPWLLGALTLDAALLAVLTLSGTAVLAAGRHRSYSLGWVAATVVAFAALLLPLSTEARAVVSLAVGPVCGTALHWIAVARGPAAPTDGRT